MGNRLSKIYTRTGDKGTTGLGNGTRTSKDSLRVDAMGDVDELNSSIGIMLAEGIPSKLNSFMIRVQHDLFNIGGEISMPGHSFISKDRVEAIEQLIDELNTKLTPLKEFILPGGCKQASQCHLARTICRRAERKLVALSNAEEVTEVSIQYVNRLSDLLFVMSRTLNSEFCVSDVLWDHDLKPNN